MTQQNEATRKEAALVDDIRRELDGPPGSPDGRRQLLARALAALTKAAPPVEAAHVLDASGLNCSCHARFSTQWEAREHAGLSHGGPLAALATPLPVDAGGGLETLVVRLGELLAKASLPWEVDSEHDGDAEYGGGPDPDRGYDNFIVFDGKGQIVADTINSDAKCIVEEPHCDEDGYRSAWDETGKANTDLIVEAVNALPMLLAALASPPVVGPTPAALQQGHAASTRGGSPLPVETAPKDGSYFLFVGTNFDGGMAVVHWDDDLEWWQLDDGKNPEVALRHEAGLTGWLPLPELTDPQAAAKEPSDVR